MSNMRDKYGVTLQTTTGPMTIKCSSRTEAERVRRVIAKWWRQSGAQDWKTLNDLAELAKVRPGTPAEQIISEFRRKSEEGEKK